MIAQLDAPVYVERVALFDAKQRVRAREGDREGAPAPGRGPGLLFVEILSSARRTSG